MKSNPATFPQTLQGAMAFFADPANGLEFMCTLRWPDGTVRCPHCQSERVSFISTRSKWKCIDCTKQFSAKVGTIFEDSPLGYDKWFPAMWMICNAKNGISSYEIHRAIGVTQKTAWFMLHRIRLAMQSGSFDKMSGEIEADETFIGSKSANRHFGKKTIGTGPMNMTAVAGLLERGTEEKPSRVKVRVARSRRKVDLQANIRDSVTKGSAVFTDALKSYAGLDDAYIHEFIDHAETYVRGRVHTNGLENFWSLLKRCIRGTYVNVEPFHLFRYLDEQAFRFNERKDCDAGRFLRTAIGVLGKRLTYLSLTDGKGGEDLQLA